MFEAFCLLSHWSREFSKELTHSHPSSHKFCNHIASLANIKEWVSDQHIVLVSPVIYGHQNLNATSNINHIRIEVISISSQSTAITDIKRRSRAECFCISAACRYKISRRLSITLCKLTRFGFWFIICKQNYSQWRNTLTQWKQKSLIVSFFGPLSLRSYGVINWQMLANS